MKDGRRIVMAQRGWHLRPGREAILVLLLVLGVTCNGTTAADDGSCVANPSNCSPERCEDTSVNTGPCRQYRKLMKKLRDGGGAWREIFEKNAHAAGGVRPPIVNPFWLQDVWEVDPGNSSTHASDANDCETTLTPCLHRWEIDARTACGGGLIACPGNRQNTTITVMSSYPSNAAADADPWIITPNVGNASSMQILGALTSTTQCSTGTITVVQSKNRTTSAELEIGLSAVGTCQSGSLIVNTSAHGGRVMMANVPNGVGFFVGQPLSGTQSMGALPTEVDNWTTGDGFTAYNVPQINAIHVEPIVNDSATSGSSASNTPLLISQLELLNTGGSAGGMAEALTLEGSTLVSDCVIDRNIVSTRGGGFTPSLRLIDNWYGGSVSIVSPPPPGQATNIAPNSNGVPVNAAIPSIFGGSTNGGVITPNVSLTNVWIDYDTRYMDSCFLSLQGSNLYGCVLLTSTVGMRVLNGYMYPTKAGACGTNAIIWAGANGGRVELEGMSRWSYTGATATNTFLGAVTLEMNGRTGSTACTHSGASPDVVNCGQNLNVTNLDATQGSGASPNIGFGGFAYNPGGSAYSSAQ